MTRTAVRPLVAALVVAPALALAVPAAPSAGPDAASGAVRWVARQPAARCFPGFLSARLAGTGGNLPVNAIPLARKYQVGQALATRFERLAPPHGRADAVSGSWDPASRLGAVARTGDEYAEVVVFRSAGSPPAAAAHRRVPPMLSAGLGIGSSRAAVERYFGAARRPLRSARACALTAQAFATEDVPVFAYRFVYRDDRVVAFSFHFEV